MERVKLQNDLEVSRLVYGMWRVSDDKDTSPAHVQAKVEACLDQGITTIDQADIYGGYAAESVLGNCLKSTPSLRDQIEIVTKCDIVAPVGNGSLLIGMFKGFEELQASERIGSAPSFHVVQAEVVKPLVAPEPVVEKISEPVDSVEPTVEPAVEPEEKPDAKEATSEAVETKESETSVIKQDEVTAP